MQKDKNIKNNRNANFVAIVCFVAFVVMFINPIQNPVFAQSGESEARVEQQLNSISRQLRALQERLLEHFSNHGQAVGGNDANYQGSDRTLLADMEVRLGAIDSEFRTLTGQIEEMGYRQRQLETQFENFKADMELRLQDLNSAAIEPIEEEHTADKAVEQALEPVVETNQNDEVAVDNLEPLAEELSPIVLTPKPPEESYEQAFGFLRRGDYQGAENAFIDFLGTYANHELAGNAQYWLAETYYARRDYTNAASAFLKGYQDYSEGAKAPDSLLKLGMSLAAMGQTAEACLAFEDITIRYSDATENLLNSAKREAERNSCN